MVDRTHSHLGYRFCRLAICRTKWWLQLITMLNVEITCCLPVHWYVDVNFTNIDICILIRYISVFLIFLLFCDYCAIQSSTPSPIFWVRILVSRSLNKCHLTWRRKEYVYLLIRWRHCTNSTRYLLWCLRQMWQMDCKGLKKLIKFERKAFDRKKYKKLIRRWDSERELSLRRYCTRTKNTIDSCINSATDRFLQRKFTKFGEIMQCNGHYAVQGHSRSPILVPIES